MWGLIAGAVFLAWLNEADVRRFDASLKKWRPHARHHTRKEHHYRADLAAHLRKSDKEEECYIIEESGSMKARGDIEVRFVGSEKRIIIELKLNLRTSSELNRLIGQAERSKATQLYIILIDPDPNMLPELDMWKENKDNVTLDVWS
jgi:hypothetical protein